MVLDTLGMFDAAAAMPEQVAVAADTAWDLLEHSRLPRHENIANVVVVGMGGSGIAGDVIREIAGPFMAVPVVVHKGYGVPNFVDESTLVIAVSFSGDTEETLEAVGDAINDGARLLAVSAGGKLADLARGLGAPHLPVPDGIPMPRAGIGALAVPSLVALERLGLFPGGQAWVAAAVSQLSKRRDALIAEDNLARTLARRVGRHFPIVYGGNGLGGLAALRWKNQFNENAKVASFWNQVPELTHNEIAGWGQDGDVTRQVFELILLRHDFEHPQVTRRFDLVDEIMDEVVGGIHTVQAEGDGMLAQLLDLMLVGDFVTLHCAAEEGLDPGPVPILDDIKRRLDRG